MDVQKSGHGGWQRYIYSPRFSDNGEVCEARNTPSIALTLEAGHYKLLVPPDAAEPEQPCLGFPFCAVGTGLFPTRLNASPSASA